MHFSVNASDINAGMNLVSHAISVRPMRDVYANVLVESTDEGIMLTCTDGEMTIRTRVSATVAQEGVALLPARLFGDLLRKLDGEVDIEVGDDYKAKISSQGSNTHMIGLEASEFPDVPEVLDREFAVEIPQNKLKDAIGRVMFAVSADETRRILTGVLMEIMPQEVRLVGLDGFRLALLRIAQETELPAGTESVSAIIPGRMLGEFSRMMEDDDTPVRVVCGKSRFSLSFGSTDCYSTLLSGEFINYKQILPKASKSQVRLRRDDFISAIDRASLIAREGKNNLVRLSLTQDEMTITANADMGSVKEVIPVSYTENEFRIAFNARYLYDVIRNVYTEELCMRFNSNVSPCVIAPVEGDHFTYLVLPVRVME